MDTAALVRRAKAGDGEAIGALYEQNYKKVYYLALKLTGNRESAEDITQDAFMAAFKALPGLEKEASFDKWLMQIAANRCRNLKKHDSFTTELPEGFEEFEPDPKESLIPENVLEDESKREIILGIIRSLPDAQRECVMLFYYSEMSVAEIAESLGVSENTVKSRLKYARDKIKAAVLETEERDGIRLHAFVPFALLFARDMESATAGISVPALTAGTAATAAGAAAVKTAGTAAVKAGLFSTFKAKVIAGVVAASVAVGVPAAVVLTRDTEPEQPDEPDRIEEPDDDEERGSISDLIDIISPDNSSDADTAPEPEADDEVNSNVVPLPDLYPEPDTELNADSEPSDPNRILYWPENLVFADIGELVYAKQIGYCITEPGLGDYYTYANIEHHLNYYYANENELSFTVLCPESDEFSSVIVFCQRFTKRSESGTVVIDPIGYLPAEIDKKDKYVCDDDFYYLVSEADESEGEVIHTADGALWQRTPDAAAPYDANALRLYPGDSITFTLPKEDPDSIVGVFAYRCDDNQTPIAYDSMAFKFAAPPAE